MYLPQLIILKDFRQVLCYYIILLYSTNFDKKYQIANGAIDSPDLLEKIFFIPQANLRNDLFYIVYHRTNYS